MQKIHEAGFNVSLSTEQSLTKEMAEQFYGEHKDKEFYSELTDFMCRYLNVRRYTFACIEVGYVCVCEVYAL